jgi:hypothetical protein
MDVKETEWEEQTGFIWLMKGPVPSSCEHRKEPWHPIKFWEFLDQLNHY